MIHIGRSETKTTLCGQSVARRWWVEAAHRRYGMHAGLHVYEDVQPDGVTCKACIKAAS